MHRQYKISEFAKHLGVTPGFLKHHEQYGTLKPHVSESGYRYYQPSDGMQVLNCLKLQGMGFTSREAADILNTQAQDPTEIFHAQQQTLAHKILFYQETLNYLQEVEAQSRALSAAGGEMYALEECPPFYYLENRWENEFVSNPLLHEVAAAWNDLMPLVDHASRIGSVSLTSGGVQAEEYCTGLCVRKDRADKLGLFHNEKVRLVNPGCCLVYRFQGLRERANGDRQTSLDLLLGRPLAFCRSHHFIPRGDVYVIKLFCSLALPENHVRETVMIPLGRIDE